MNKALREWLETTLHDRPHAVVVPSASRLDESKIARELRREGYEKYGNQEPYAWEAVRPIWELPHPAHETTHRFTLLPFSILDRRTTFNRATRELIRWGRWRPRYKSLTLFTSLGDAGKSYCRPNPWNPSPERVEASYRARNFEDISKNRIFDELAVKTVDGADYLVVEASPEELLRGSRSEEDSEKEQYPQAGAASSLRPMKGYWIVRTNWGEADGLTRKFGLTDLRALRNPLEDLDPDDLWALNLCEAWVLLHGASASDLSPLDFSELYDINALRRPRVDDAVYQQLIRLVRQGHSSVRNYDFESWAEYNGVKPFRDFR